MSLLSLGLLAAGSAALFLAGFFLVRFYQQQKPFWQRLAGQLKTVQGQLDNLRRNGVRGTMHIDYQDPGYRRFLTADECAWSARNTLLVQKVAEGLSGHIARLDPVAAAGQPKTGTAEEKAVRAEVLIGRAEEMTRRLGDLVQKDFERRAVASPNQLVGDCCASKP